MSTNVEQDPSGLPKGIDQGAIADWEARFNPNRIGELTELYLKSGTENNLLELAKKQNKVFVVTYLPAESEFADIARVVEYKVFANAFEQTLQQVDEDYGKYDKSSTFAIVIDVSTKTPTPAGVLRIIEPSDKGFKDVNDLVDDTSENPWINEIKSEYFDDLEEYNPEEAWVRMTKRANNGVPLLASESIDIATHASADAYRGAHGSLDGVSMLFYHACLRFAYAHNYKNLLAIFDIPPFKNLQQYGEIFETYEGIDPHPYGGPYDTIPAFSVLERGIPRISENDELAGKVFREGFLIDENALLPNFYDADTYSDDAIDLVNKP